MIYIKREIKSEKMDSEINHYTRSQASFNSDGNLTLRNYDVNSKDNDDIMIFFQNRDNSNH